jgi:hypothetical protein
MVAVPKEGKLQQSTIDSIKNVSKEGDQIISFTYSESVEEALNTELEKVNEEDFTHIVLIYNGSVLRTQANDVVTQYIKNNEAVYLPIVQLNDFESGEFKGFLNSCIWKPHAAETTGEVTLALAKKGIDLIIDGAYIPVSVAKKFRLKESIKYFSQFEFLSRLTHNNISVFGIPKVTITCNRDFELRDVPKPEKIKYFKEAQESYMVD